MRTIIVVCFLSILAGVASAQTQTPDSSKWMCRNLADSGGFIYEGETVFGAQACRPIPQAAPATLTASKQDVAAPTAPAPASNTAPVPKQENAVAPGTATTATPQSVPEPVATQAVSGQHFNFEREQRVYVVAVSTRSRDLDLTKSDLEVERYAKDQFKKSKEFVVASTLRGADFVFLILFDSTSNGPEEQALAALPEDYQKYGSNLDALRNAALWQSSGHVNMDAHAMLGIFTMGGSMLFDHPNLARSLVKRFQKETISK